jgi:hypothetical protein
MIILYSFQYICMLNTCSNIINIKTKLFKSLMTFILVNFFNFFFNKKNINRKNI